MRNIPLVVGFGGISSAGRSSLHLGYQRIIYDALSEDKQQQTLQSLALLMGLVTSEKGVLKNKTCQLSAEQLQALFADQILNNTLIRKIHSTYFDTAHVPLNKKVQLKGGFEALDFIIAESDLPKNIPETWQVSTLANGQVKVSCESLNVLLEDTKEFKVSTAGQLPTGLNISALYASRHHPKGLEMTVFGASDAIGSLGIDIDEIKSLLPADKIGVYASSSMGQLDDNGVAGYTKSAMMGKRATSKQLPFGFPEMPGDFINAYMLGSAGFTGGVVGACASFLYNLEHAVKDIQSGRRHVAFVGVSEAPITPEIIEGYRTMGALADDDDLLALDKHLDLKEPRYSRACRPFGENCGFVMAESAQFAVLFSAEFALKTGANVLGTLPAVFNHADGFKKSIASPGIGNYLTLGRAVSFAESLLGENAVRHKSYVHAHGTGTPQNRITESHVINEIAKAKGIRDWPVSSVKCYVGHSLGAAGGDQMMAALGSWNAGIIPGMFSVDQFANDIYDTHLRFSQKHIEVGKTGMEAAFLNSKGFGGNNATACLLSPSFGQNLLEDLAGKEYKALVAKQEKVLENIQQYQNKLNSGDNALVYHFDHAVLEGSDLTISQDKITIPGFEESVSLDVENPY